MTGTSSRRKGMTYENAVYNHLISNFDCKKQNRSGYDGDDLLITRGLIVVSAECKNQKKMALSAWVDQAKANAQQALPVVIHKRIGRSDIGQHYVTMELDSFLELLRRTP